MHSLRLDPSDPNYCGQLQCLSFFSKHLFKTCVPYGGATPGILSPPGMYSAPVVYRKCYDLYINNYK